MSAIQHLVLPRSEIAIGSIGFGAAYLVGGFERRRNIKLVETAFDAGIRHFDVAPIYGLGTAEEVLGSALRRCRGSVTIATKVGLSWRKPKFGVLLAHALYQPVRGLRPDRAPKYRASIPRSTPGRFDAPFVEAALNQSLSRLGTDYIDLYLLHEAFVSDVNGGLLDFLARCREKGICRAIGVASSYETAIAIEKKWPKFFDVYQFSWSALDDRQDLPSPTTFTITHRAILRAFGPIKTWLRSEKQAQNRLATASGVDVSSDVILADLLLAAALESNPTGLVLAASRRQDRVRRFQQLASNTDIRVAAQNFLAALLLEVGRPDPQPG